MFCPEGIVESNSLRTGIAGAFSSCKRLAAYANDLSPPLASKSFYTDRILGILNSFSLKVCGVEQKF